MGEISMIGLDLAKNVFQVHGVDASGSVVLRRQLRRGAVEKFFAQLPPWARWRLKRVVVRTTGRG
jgi:transposase